LINYYYYYYYAAAGVWFKVRSLPHDKKKKKKKKKFIWLNTITMNMTIFKIKQSQVARKP